jgi:regulator of cell morphogenesis and NO signaling
MKLEEKQTVGEVAAALPAATRVFEELGIDYCCGGGATLQSACKAKGISYEKVAESLAALEAHAPKQERDWRTAPLAELVGHIVAKHHGFVRSENPRLSALIAKVVGVHGKNHPELVRVQQLFAQVEQELTMHMMKEEQILFPAVIEMEQAFQQGRSVLPPMFGTVKNPIRMMIMEHDSAGDAFTSMHEASQNFTAPADACISYRTLYNALLEFEADLHQHIHLENNILFPRAIELEEKQ